MGKEIVFKIKKDRMYLRVADGDQKMLTYAVVAEKPTPNSDTDATERSSQVRQTGVEVAR